MVLMEVKNSSGVVNRCDAKCYNAEHPDCDCICGGRNHGAGLQKALGNTMEHARQMIEEYAGKKGIEEFDATIGSQVFQTRLF